jgi:hypothetical protein
MLFITVVQNRALIFFCTLNRACSDKCVYNDKAGMYQAHYIFVTFSIQMSPDISHLGKYRSTEVKLLSKQNKREW